MSKLYNKYLSLKKDYGDDTKLLFKSGIFYVFLSDDATILSNILNLKLTNLNSEIVKCGFPLNNIIKYINILNEKEIKFKIIDENLKPIDSLDKYLSDEKILNMINKIKKMDMDLINPKQAYELMYEFNGILKKGSEI